METIARTAMAPETVSLARGVIASGALTGLLLTLVVLIYSRSYIRHTDDISMTCTALMVMLRRVMWVTLGGFFYLLLSFTLRLAFAAPRNPLEPEFVQWVDWGMYPVLFVTLLTPTVLLVGVMRSVDKVKRRRGGRHYRGLRKEGL